VSFHTRFESKGKIMLNIRTFIFAVGLIVVLALTAQFVTAGTEAASTSLSEVASLPNDQDQPANTNSVGVIASYRSPLDECFDVSLREAAACRESGQTTIPSYQYPLDECFDVSIQDVASCRATSRTPAP
jgi:hypothetical protein